MMAPLLQLVVWVWQWVKMLWLLLALVFIYFILGEHILPSTYIGLVLIMMGLWIQQKKVKDREEALNLG